MKVFIFFQHGAIGCVSMPREKKSIPKANSYLPMEIYIFILPKWHTICKLLNIDIASRTYAILYTVNEIIFSPAERWPQFLTPHRNYVTTAGDQSVSFVLVLAWILIICSK